MCPVCGNDEFYEVVLTPGDRFVDLRRCLVNTLVNTSFMRMSDYDIKDCRSAKCVFLDICTKCDTALC